MAHDIKHLTIEENAILDGLDKIIGPLNEKIYQLQSEYHKALQQDHVPIGLKTELDVKIGQREAYEKMYTDIGRAEHRGGRWKQRPKALTAYENKIIDMLQSCAEKAKENVERVRARAAARRKEARMLSEDARRSSEFHSECDDREAERFSSFASSMDRAVTLILGGEHRR